MRRSDDPHGWGDADIARAYAGARTELSEAMRAQWVGAFRSAIPATTPIARVLDLGCGTARFTALLGETFGATAIGVDRSPAMLRERASDAHARTLFAAAGADAIPLANGCIDVALLSMVVHLLPDLGAVLREVARVMRGGGWVLIRTPMRETLDRVCFLPYFPDARHIDEARMPTRTGLVGGFAAAGFVAAGHRELQQEFAATPEEACAKVRTRAFSTLRMISDEAFARGVAAYEAACRTAPAGPVVDPIELFTFRRATRGSG